MKIINKAIGIILAFTFVLGLAGCSNSNRLSHEKLSEFFSARNITKCSNSANYLAVCNNPTDECIAYVTCKDAEAQSIFNELSTSYNQQANYSVKETTSCVLSQESINGFYLVFLFTFENSSDAEAFYQYNAQLYGGGVTGQEKDYSYSYTVNNVTGDMYQMNCFYISGDTVLFIAGWSTETSFVTDICSTLDIVSPF